MSRYIDALTLHNLSPRDRRAVLLGLAVLLPALLWVAAVRPYRAALEDVRERTAAEQALLQRERALIATNAAPGALAELEARAERAALRLVSAANVPLAEAEVIGFLQELAQLSRVLLQELRGVEPRRTQAAAASAAASATPAALQPIRLALRGESDLEGVMMFLQRIEASPLLLRVTELSIEPQRDGRGGERRPDGAVTFSLQLDAFAVTETDSTPTAAAEAGT
jgi:hypothetical protein